MSSDIVSKLLEFAPPLDFVLSLEPFRRWGNDHLVSWDRDTLVSTARQRQSAVAFLLRPSGTPTGPRATVQFEAFSSNCGDYSDLTRAVQELFPPVPPFLEELCEIDAAIRFLRSRYPGLAPVRHPDLLSALIRHISAQQVNLFWATQVRSRLADRFGRRHEIGQRTIFSFDAAHLATATTEEIRALQFTTRKAEAIVALSSEIAAGRLSREQLEALPDERVLHELTKRPGIGLWTAEWILVRTLGRPRVVAGDLGVRKAVGLLYHVGSIPSEQQVRQMTAHWGQAANFAQALALHHLATAPGVRPDAPQRNCPGSD